MSLPTHSRTFASRVQVWVSEDAAVYSHQLDQLPAGQVPGASMDDLAVRRLGDFDLKGVKEQLKLLQCSLANSAPGMAAAGLSPRSHASLSAGSGAGTGGSGATPLASPGSGLRAFSSRKHASQHVPWHRLESLLVPAGGGGGGGGPGAGPCEASGRSGTGGRMMSSVFTAGVAAAALMSPAQQQQHGAVKGSLRWSEAAAGNGDAGSPRLAAPPLAAAAGAGDHGSGAGGSPDGGGVGGATGGDVRRSPGQLSRFGVQGGGNHGLPTVMEGEAAATAGLVGGHAVNPLFDEGHAAAHAGSTVAAPGHVDPASRSGDTSPRSPEAECGLGGAVRIALFDIAQSPRYAPSSPRAKVVAKAPTSPHRGGSGSGSSGGAAVASRGGSQHRLACGVSANDPVGGLGGAADAAAHVAGEGVGGADGEGAGGDGAETGGGGEAPGAAQGGDGGSQQPTRSAAALTPVASAPAPKMKSHAGQLSLVVPGDQKE